jgi:hypothetical protein
VVDQLLPEILLGQISYPNDQLNISNEESLVLAQEWISAFSQHCGVTPPPQTNCLRVFGNPQGVQPGTSTAGQSSLPTAPPDLATLLLQTLGKGR